MAASCSTDSLPPAAGGGPACDEARAAACISGVIISGARLGGSYDIGAHRENGGE